MTKKLITALIFSASLSALAASDGGPLAAGFREPPRGDAPHLTLHWINGTETKESITKNLEAFSQANPGAILLFSGGFEALPEGPVGFMSDQWKELLAHAVREAKRLGMPFGINLVEGGNGMGGPWIKPEESMHALVWSRTQIDGPFQGTIDLPQPFTRFGYYHDVAVLAVPRSAQWATAMREAQPTVTAKTWDYEGTEEIYGPNGIGMPKRFAGGRLFDGLPQTATAIQGANGNYIQMDFPAPFEAAGLFVCAMEKVQLPDFTYELQALQGGKYVPIASFRPEKRDPVRLTFEPTTSKSFRLVLTGKATGKSKKTGSVMLSEVELLGPGERGSADYLLPGGVLKAGLAVPAGNFGKFNDRATTSEGKEVPLSAVQNLTGKMDTKGRLTVSLPEGSWTIYRFGYTSTGSTGHWQTTGAGLEVDRFRPEGVEAQFERMVDPIIKAIGPEAADNWKYTHIEGWELGHPTWTPGFEKVFAERRGYDPTPYLPILAGEEIGGPEITERFLWDFRRTIGDLFSQVFYRRWTELAHERGLQSRVQAVSANQIWDLSQAMQECDFPTSCGMFNWLNDGKSVVIGEADEVVAASLLNKEPSAACMFWPRAGYLYSPRDFKAAGDLILATGYTQMITAGKGAGDPGGGPDVFFHPSQTWWTNAGKAWSADVQRCQYLLRQGTPVADVLVFSGDGVPDTATVHAEIPAGYRYGLVSRDVLADLKVEDGQIVAPSGVRFRFLLLPEQERMTVETLERIEELAKAGATVLGSRPKHTPGLGNYPESEKRLQSLADVLWGRADQASGVNKVGSGQVVWGKTPAEWLAGEQVPPDFSAGNAKDSMLFTHRRTEDADIYFLSNQQGKDVDFDGAFRVAGRSPELWNPVTGEIVPVGVAQEKNGVTHIPLRLGPFGSLFVIFRDAKDAVRPVAALEFGNQALPVALPGEVEKMPAAILRQGDAGAWKLEGWQNGSYTIRNADGRKRSVAISALPAAQELSGPWQVRFPQGSGAPQEADFSELISWPEAKDPGIQHFSGTAEYEIRFEAPENWLGSGRSVMLDLGRVEQVAEVSLNGGKWTTLWKPPYRLPVTKDLRAGENTLKVRVTNVWNNRMIADAKLPEGERFVKTAYQPYKGNEPLLPAGLLGPVRLVPGKIESLP